MRTSSTEMIIDVLWILSRDIESEDGVANAAIREAAQRLEELERARDALRSELDSTIRLSRTWENDVKKISVDRDYWKAEAERWKEINK